ncbi:MAG: hypothetical protein IKV98_10485 [Clostridia bacterium]|nr:hypothetical protein [Clostridia bacterium]
MEILLGIYIIASYWAAGRTIFANWGALGVDGWMRLALYKLFVGMLLGIVLIPIAIIKAKNDD